MRAKISFIGVLLYCFVSSCRPDVSDQVERQDTTMLSDTVYQMSEEVYDESSDSISVESVDFSQYVSIDSVGKRITLPEDINDDTYRSSFDKRIYLDLDTVISYDYSDTAFAVLIVNNYTYIDENTVQDCHACAPLIEAWTYQRKGQGQWKLIQSRGIQKNNGQWGQKGTVTLEYLGEDLPVLGLDSGEYTGQGYTSGVKEFFSLVQQDRFKKVFEYRYISDSTGAYGDEGELMVTQMNWNAKETYPEITLNTIDKLSNKSTSQRFNYIDTLRVYEMPKL